MSLAELNRKLAPPGERSVPPARGGGGPVPLNQVWSRSRSEGSQWSGLQTLPVGSSGLAGSTRCSAVGLIVVVFYSMGPPRREGEALHV